MNDFVEQCRREWERLGVPDSVANEMAADLAADLEEAERDGVAAEEVLGVGAFDAAAFAHSWAAERGVIPPTPPPPPPPAPAPEVEKLRREPRWSSAALAGAVALGVVALLLAVAAATHSDSGRVKAVVGPARLRPFAPQPVPPPDILRRSVLPPDIIGRFTVPGPHPHSDAWAFILVILLVLVAGFAGGTLGARLRSMKSRTPAGVSP